jgi:penicillin amidase
MKLIENIFKDELGDNLYQAYIGAANEMFKGFQLIMAKADSNWFDDISTTGVKEGRDDIIRKSIELAIDDLRERFGKDMTKWHWGELHHHLSGHLVFKDVKYLKNFFNIGPFPVGGSKATVAPAAYDFANPYTATHGASTREIIDFSDRTNDKRVITSGCSGQFHSKFYVNQSKLWRKGETHAILMDRKQTEENSAATLTLIPKKENR